jgi:hypothetical protein
MVKFMKEKCATVLQIVFLCFFIDVYTRFVQSVYRKFSGVWFFHTFAQPADMPVQYVRQML